MREAIYKGATRPAMKFGVPLVPLVTLAGGGMLSIVWGGLLVSWWSAAVVVALVFPLLAAMRLVTRHDDHRLRQLFMAARVRARHRNQPLWRARSYSPTLYRGVTDAWHR